LTEAQFMDGSQQVMKNHDLFNGTFKAIEWNV